MLASWLAASVALQLGFGRLSESPDVTQHTTPPLTTPDLVLCPISINLREQGAATPPTAAGHVSLTLLNTQMRNLELLYVDGGGSEKRYWVVDARGNFTITTRPADTWRLRMKTGDLAAEITVGGSRVQLATIGECVPADREEGALAATALRVHPPSPPAFDECDPWAHLSGSEPSPGFHVLCVTKPESDDPGVVEVSVWTDGWSDGIRPSSRPTPSYTLRVPTLRLASESASESENGNSWLSSLGGGGGGGALHALASLVMARTPARGPKHPLPAFYSPRGSRLSSLQELLTLRGKEKPRIKF